MIYTRTSPISYFQMDTMAGPTTSREPSGQEREPVDRSTTDGKAEMPPESEEPQGQGTNEEGTSGRKGFKFGRLKEEMNFQSTASELEDPSVIIANPAYLEGNHKKQKKGAVRKPEQVDKLGLSSHDQEFTQGGGIINRMYQEGEDPQHKDEEDGNQEVLDDMKTNDDSKVESDER